MRKVTTINLNNNAYQIDEEGFEALRAYLDQAARALADNPDREEILADLEQAIADKCRMTLGAHKTVVSAAEIERILKEMGPVVGSGGEASANAGTSGSTAGTSGAGSSGSGGWRHRRLYRITEGQKWAGICQGIAAYASIDVSLVRLAVILITLFTGFFPGILVYIVMAFVLPVATTGEEMAAAHGQPFNAQELVDRVKKKHEDFRAHFREKRRMRREAHWWGPAAPPFATQPPPGAAARMAGGLLLPVLTVLSAVWFAAMALAAFSVWTGYRHGWPPGAFYGDYDVPRWILFVAIIAVYAVLAIPIGAGRRAALFYANGGRPHGWADAWSGVLWIALVAVVFLVAWNQLPLLQDLLRELTQSPRNVISVQHWLDVADGDDLVTALTARGAHLHGIALLLAYQGTGNR